MNDLKELFVRDLNRLKNEVEQYEDEKILWVKKGEIKNSAGNLALHLCGNLKHFIGAVLSNNGYKRDRPFEFEGKSNASELVKNINETIEVLNNYFDSANEKQLSETYPIEVFKYPMTTFYFLVHLQGHLNYHLGQINYHRRIISDLG